MSTVAELRAEGRRALAAGRAASEPREATLLLARVLGVDEAGVIARLRDPLAEPLAARYRSLVSRRAAGEPFAYLTGEREFYGRAFRVDPRVLIPRPETEHLVEAVLAATAGLDATVLDVGTGSGCIAITLALEAPRLRLLACDRSVGALAVAAVNRRRLGVDDRVRLLAADLLHGCDPGRVDVVVSNPPYVATSDAGSLPPDVVEHEPHAALFASEDGLDCLRRLLEAAGDDGGLRPGALLATEVGAGQAPVVAELAAPAFELERTVSDHAGHQRVVVLRRRPVRQPRSA